MPAFDSLYNSIDGIYKVSHNCFEWRSMEKFNDNRGGFWGKNIA